MRKNFSRRDVLAGTGAVALGLASTRVVSAAPSSGVASGLGASRRACVIRV